MGEACLAHTAVYADAATKCVSSLKAKSVVWNLVVIKNRLEQRFKAVFDAG